MCCFPLSFADIASVKVMRDGDGDGKCQEEDGKWVPCPPGVATGTRLRNGKPLGTTIGQLATLRVAQPTRDFLADKRKKAADKAAEIVKAQQDVSREKRAAARKFNTSTLVRNLEKMTPEEQLDKFGTLFEHEIIGRSGAKYNSKVSRVETKTTMGMKEVRFAGAIYDSDGKRVGKFSRTFLFDGDRPPTVVHVAMDVNEDNRKDGIASTLNALNETIYKEMGFTKIRTLGVSGGDMKGATHWPRNGFTWNDSRAKDKFLNVLNDLLAAADESQRTRNKYFADEREYEILQELVAAAENQDFSDPDSLTPADLLHFQGAEEWFKKQRISLSYSRSI